MLYIKTKLAPSPIHGIGVFAEEFVPKGAKVWEWHEGVDQRIPPDVMATLPEVAQNTIKRYSWMLYGVYYLLADNDRFLNHSTDPTCITGANDVDFAARDIQIGDELTVDYSKFDPNFGNPEFGYDWVN